MATAQVEIEVDLPEGVSIRDQGAHVFEVDFELPPRCACSHCLRDAETNLRLKKDVLVNALIDQLLLAAPNWRLAYISTN